MAPGDIRRTPSRQPGMTFLSSKVFTTWSTGGFFRSVVSKMVPSVRVPW